MSGVVKIDMTESSELLKSLLAQQKTAVGKERVQALYLLKTKQIETVQHLAGVLGRNRVTVQRWWSQDRQGGIKQLLAVDKPKGRPGSIPEWAIAGLQQELVDPEGFETYGEVQLWLKAVLGIEANYHVVHNWVRYKLKAKLKVPRPRRSEQDPKAIENFKKKLSNEIQAVVSSYGVATHKFQKIRALVSGRNSSRTQDSWGTKNHA